MDKKDWELFSMLRHSKSLSQAATMLFVTQPALTKRIKLLESELDVLLIERNNMGIALTTAGQYFADYSDEMLEKYQNLKNFISQKDDKIQYELSVGVPRMMSQFVMPKLLQSFSMQYPNIRLLIRSGFSTNIKQWLRDGDIQIAFLRGNITGYEQQIVSCDPLCLVCKDEIPFSKLPELPRIIYFTDTQLSDSINRWWHLTFPNQTPRIGMQVGDSQTCVEMLLHTSGYAIVPKYIINPILSSQIYMKPLSYPNGTQVMRLTSLVYRYEQLEIPPIAEFVKFCKHYFTPINLPPTIGTV